MEEIDKIHLTRALKHLREGQQLIKRTNRDDAEVLRIRLELERAIQHLAGVLAREL